LSHTRERRRAKRFGRKESVEEAPRKSLSRLPALPLDLAHAATPLALLLQREPARRLFVALLSLELINAIYTIVSLPVPRSVNC